MVGGGQRPQHLRAISTSPAVALWSGPRGWGGGAALSSLGCGESSVLGHRHWPAELKQIWHRVCTSPPLSQSVKLHQVMAGVVMYLYLSVSPQGCCCCQGVILGGVRHPMAASQAASQCQVMSGTAACHSSAIWCLTASLPHLRLAPPYQPQQSQPPQHLLLLLLLTAPLLPPAAPSWAQQQQQQQRPVL